MLEEITLIASQAGFDVPRIRAYYRKRWNWSPDPVEPEGLDLIARSAELLDCKLAIRRGRPGGALPLGLWIHVRPDRVYVSQRCNQKDLENAQALVQWIVDEYPCRIIDDMGDDRTEECRESVAPLYAEDDD